MNFYKSQGKMKGLLTGDIARETLELAEDEYEYLKTNNIETQSINIVRPILHPIPKGEDIKWSCGECGANNWTCNINRCKYCTN